MTYPIWFVPGAAPVSADIQALLQRCLAQDPTLRGVKLVELWNAADASVDEQDDEADADDADDGDDDDSLDAFDLDAEAMAEPVVEFDDGDVPGAAEVQRALDAEEPAPEDEPDPPQPDPWLYQGEAELDDDEVLPVAMVELPLDLGDDLAAQVLAALGRLASANGLGLFDPSAAQAYDLTLHAGPPLLWAQTVREEQSYILTFVAAVLDEEADFAPLAQAVAELQDLGAGQAEVLLDPADPLAVLDEDDDGLDWPVARWLLRRDLSPAQSNQALTRAVAVARALDLRLLDDVLDPIDLDAPPHALPGYARPTASSATLRRV